MTKEQKFTHLHVHTEYSLLDGSAKIDDLLKRCKELGMDSLAITDHGVMYGVIDFYKAAKKHDIKPIIGCEIYVAPNSRFEKVSNDEKRYSHLVLLAENEEGYKNLIKLVSKGFIEGFYYKPRVDLDLLKEHSAGLIALSACFAGPIARLLLNSSFEKALEMALVYDEVFGRDNFFLELQDHLVDEYETQKVNNGLIEISKQTGIPLVCTNDSHYIYKEDSVAHDILLCIQTQSTVQEENRMRYSGSEFYLKSPQEMFDLFSYAPEAFENTSKIADRCNVEIEFHKIKLPKYDTPKEFTPLEYLQKLTMEGLQKKYINPSKAHLDRLNFEIKVITDMAYVDYFLIVWDFIKYAKDNGISVGPGRGSSAGSIVAFTLDITNVDPIKYDLIFERFLNPERISMPDIDIDFCYERRQEVIDYVIEKYGETHVAQIITFGTLAARAAIKDVGRALAMPYAEVDKISKMIPFMVKISIDKALEMNKELYNIYETDNDVRYLIDMSRKLEGLPRHSSTHAAGVLICSEDVTEYVPLNTNDGAITTQFPMNNLEELGLLKMDFLGLRTLTVIDSAVKEIERNYNISLDMYKIDYSQKEVFTMISQAKTEGVFQLESRGMKAFLKELKPSKLEDLIAGVALFRPGPMDFIPKYVKGKNSAGKTTYTHESLIPILEQTYGCIVYQEQVMQIVRELAGYSLARSDLLRRVMSKKETSLMRKEKDVFLYGNDDDVVGCVKNGIPIAAAEKIFAEMLDFAKYAFPKAHAAAYAILAYQTAWLKVNYPIEFMAASMTSVMDSSGKISEYIAECKELSIELLPPSINESFLGFAVAKGKIRFALSAIKNVGRNSIQNIIIEREKNGPFLSLTEFINRMDSSDLNKRMIESLIKSGSFDCFNSKRSQLMQIYSGILEGVSENAKRNLQGQVNLFDNLSQEHRFLDTLPNMQEFDSKTILAQEKEVIGVYITGHPLDPYKDMIAKSCTVSTADFQTVDDENIVSEMMAFDNQKASVAGIIVSITKRYTKNNQPMAFLTIEDLFGFMEIIVFPKTFERYVHLIEKEICIFVEGTLTVSAEDGEVKIKAEHMAELSGYEQENKVKVIGLVIESDKTSLEISDIIDLTSAYKGYIPVYIHDKRLGQKYKLSPENFVKYDEVLIAELENMLGKTCVVIK